MNKYKRFIAKTFFIFKKLDFKPVRCVKKVADCCSIAYSFIFLYMSKTTLRQVAHITLQNNETNRRKKVTDKVLIKNCLPSRHDHARQTCSMFVIHIFRIGKL